MLSALAEALDSLGQAFVLILEDMRALIRAINQHIQRWRPFARSQKREDS